MEFTFIKDMKTTNKIISCGGKCGENYHGGDMSNPDLGRTYYREDAGKPKG